MTRSGASGSRLNLYALVVAPGLVPCACRIARAVRDGSTVRLDLVELSSPGVSEHFSSRPGAQAALHVFLGNRADRQRIHFKGSVSARTEGFSFEVDDRDAMAPGDTERLFHSPTDSEPPHGNILKELYHQHCRKLLDQLLPEFMDGTFAGIEADLEQAAELREITRLKDMRFIFQSRRQRMLRDYRAQFQANQADLETPSRLHVNGSELHLLERHEFEDWLDLQAISTRISKANKGFIFLLNQFMNQVYHLDVNNDNNPLAPRALGVCLQYAVDNLGIAGENRPTLYRAWENALAKVWSAAVRSMINDFRKDGLEALEMTELPANWSLGDKVSELKKPIAESGQDQRSSAREAGQPGAASARATQSIFQLMALEDGYGTASHGTDGPNWQEPNLQLKENLGSRRPEILSRLRDGEPAMTGLLRDMADSDPEVASALDQSAVDKASLVDRIFAPLQTQLNLSAPVRQQLQMLRLPVFETLIETPDFLSEGDHPTRDIINDLMRLCLAERVSGKKLEATVADIISELTAMEKADSGLLEDVGQRLRQLVERQDQSFIRNSERLAKNLEGKERLRRTRRTAQKRLSALLGGRQTPDILVRLLEAGWEQLIVLAMLREGPQSRQCEELFDVVTQLQAWLSPDGTSGELAFEKELESGVMLQFIERELKTVGDPARTRAIIKELSGILAGDLMVTTSWLEMYGETDDAVATLPAELEQSRWASRAKGLAVGDWVELGLDSGETRRMRLVWGGEESLRFVFLSPKGMSEISYDFPEFTRKLAEGEAWLVEDGEIPFLDQSLFTVVEDIYRKLNFQATHDALTGLMHRHDFEKQVWQLINRLPQLSGQDHAALLVLDIDEFSVVNASFGAEAGDALLKSIADMLRNDCGSRFPEACTGRISGNEFAILFGSMAIEDCLDFAESLRRRIEVHVFRHGSTEYRVTVSMSIRSVTGAACSPGDLLNQASLSLGASKKLGGNRIELARGTGEKSQVSGPQWVTEIDRTIRDGSLYLRAQPIVALDPGFIEGNSYEILLGLKDSSGKEISPQGYIEAAEQFRRSTTVDLWVVSEVMSWMRQNPEAITKIATLNVNLSGASLSDDDFMLNLESTLRAKAEFAPKLCFEVTETSAIANLHFASDFMRELKRLHCRFALDDFGTGMSSYAYLQKLPVDFVKIDGAFVRDLNTNMTNYAMVRSINELCHFLDLRTIAEYVEDMEIMEALREIQVDYGQGFGIAKPRRLDSLGN